jgi:colicin import membrane protein
MTNIQESDMTETTDLAVLEIKPEQAPALYVENGLDSYYEQIERQVLGEVPDLTTAKGRARVASLAAQVSRSKTAIEKPGREYLKRLKEQPKIVEAELRNWNNKCDALRDKVREPLNQWEAEQERIKQEEEARLAAEALAKQIESDHEIALLMNDKVDRDRAEAARIAEQQRIDYEQRIAREAEERAKREAEEKAQREREESARREAELKAKAEQAERDRIAQKERAEREAKEARDMAELRAKRAQEKAERDKQEAIEAERRKAQDAEKRRLAEEQRIKDELAQRTADDNHRKRIGTEAVTALINVVGLTREQAISTFKAIKDGAVPHTKINY